MASLSKTSVWIATKFGMDAYGIVFEEMFFRVGNSSRCTCGQARIRGEWIPSGPEIDRRRFEINRLGPDLEGISEGGRHNIALSVCTRSNYIILFLGGMQGKPDASGSRFRMFPS